MKQSQTPTCVRQWPLVGSFQLVLGHHFAYLWGSGARARPLRPQQLYLDLSRDPESGALAGSPCTEAHSILAQKHVKRNELSSVWRCWLLVHMLLGSRYLVFLLGAGCSPKPLSLEWRHWSTLNGDMGHKSVFNRDPNAPK